MYSLLIILTIETFTEMLCVLNMEQLFFVEIPSPHIISCWIVYP